MKTTTFLLMLVPAVVSAQQKPATGYAPVNGLKMYYEVHGSGEPVVLLHGAFMTITNNWTGWIDELAKTRKVIAVEMQGHGRTGDIERDISGANLADDVAEHPGLGEGGRFHSRADENPLPEGAMLTFALAGNQNCGKTTLFNQLTGANHG